ncbi:MAG: Na+/H+ antiporter [Gammaproteobacteria bacterium]|nr:Na+/H+ antiporter [Gammaproteobacteria bacterium]
MAPSSDVTTIVTAIVTLMLVAAAILALTKRIKLPFTIILVLVGMMLSLLADQQPELNQLLSQVDISPDLILYVFLPTLIFESAFNLDGRQLRRNIWPVLLLAIPGLLISTILIGLMVHWATAIPLSASLLLGAILSATDPVAVVALFKKMGAPKRLTVLIEGESLFNDATAIVVSRLLIGVVLAGSLSWDTVWHGFSDIFILFVGGFLTGWVLGVLTGYLLAAVESDPYIEITLTTVLAYVSFLLAEELFHVSGVMAVVGAGLVMSSWGRMKVSPSVRNYLEQFWQYLAFFANALIFLMVGLKVELSAVWGSIDLLLWVILAMLLARAAIIYGLLPLFHRGASVDSIHRPYQHVLFWGGLRGAIALAIVLSLPEFEYSETFIALVMGVVIFTLLVQGLSIKTLMQWLGLSQSSVTDRLVQLEVSIDGKLEAKRRVQNMANTGIFSNKVTLRLHNECESQIRELKHHFETISQNELSHEQELNMLYLRVLTEERNKYVEMFNKGHLSEGAFREQLLVIALQTDAIRYNGKFQRVHSHILKRRIEQFIYHVMDKAPLLHHLSQRLKLTRIGRDYEIIWGHYIASDYVLQRIEHLTEIESMRPQVVEEVRSQYGKWHKQATEQLDLFAEQYPEFVTATQERMCRRLAINAEDEHTVQQQEYGTLSGNLADDMHTELLQRLRALRGLEVAKLKVSPEQLLQQTPFFKNLPEEEFKSVAEQMVLNIFNPGDTIIHQGDHGNSLFLIARGVVRITREDDGSCRKLATLMTGDVLGEMALLESTSRSASAHAVTACTLYELKRTDLDSILKQHPEIHNALVLIEQQRHEEIEAREPR